ncbi:MAG: FAD-binding oxidoreductase [Nitrososphaeraceae archaeon]|nr:FAD-binding oxidoreductase [Nitrososphaeraceae archaeon]
MIEADISGLRKLGLSDIFSDDWTRTIYSVDASHCTLKPSAVNFPSDKYDVQKICDYAYSRGISITCRGAGTGLLGQSLSTGIILDFTKKMNKILEIGDDYVIVQPGVVKAVLDKELARRDKFIPPDPASSNYCTIGGMLSNNSSGPHGLGYGSIINFVQRVELVYSNGTIGFADQKNYDKKIGEMLKYISSLNVDIKEHYPNVSKNSSGYRLDAVFENNRLNPQKIFVASEGSLGIITSSRISVLDIPEKKSLVILKFENILQAALAVPLILQFRPVAMELLDRGTVIEGWITDDSNSRNSCLMFVEFYGNDGSFYQEVHKFEDTLRHKAKILESGYDQKSVDRAWRERKNSLNSAIKKGIGSRKPIGIIEDTVVNPNILHDYLIFLLKLLVTYDLDYVIYGHAGNGNLHLRPIIDFNSKDWRYLMDTIAEKVFRHISKIHGSISGEHGDGLLRTKYVPMMYGATMYDIFKQIKLIFDDKKIMNPGKKVL